MIRVCKSLISYFDQDLLSNININVTFIIAKFSIDIISLLLRIVVFFTTSGFFQFIKTDILHFCRMFCII